MELIATARFKKAMDRATEADGVHAQDRRAGRRPRRQRRCEVSHPLLEKREPIKRAAAAGADAPTAACAAATTATSSARRPRAIDELEADGARRARWRSSGKRGIALLQVPRHPGRRDLHALRGQAAVRRSRGARQPLHRHATSPARSTGSTWPTRSSSASPGRRRSSRRCCRWRRSAAPTDGRRSRRRPPSRRRESSTSSCPSPESILEEVVPVVVQGPAVQVLPRRGRERADRPHGGHEGAPPRTPAR